MAHARVHYDTSSHALFFAIAISLALHILALATLPPFRFNSEKTPTVLEIVLQPPQPKPEPPPEVVKPKEPPKPEPKPQPRRPVPPNNPKPAAEPRPVPTQKAEPAPTLPQLETPSPQPAVITASPKADELPAFVAPVAEPSQPPSQDIDAMRDNYGSLLAREIAKHKQYPRIAQMRGWQGKVKVKLEISAEGAVTSSTISESSGYESLDQQALEMVKKASPLPLPPEALRHKEFSILIPVSFRLE